MCTGAWPEAHSWRRFAGIRKSELEGPGWGWEEGEVRVQCETFVVRELCLQRDQMPNRWLFWESLILKSHWMGPSRFGVVC